MINSDSLLLPALEAVSLVGRQYHRDTDVVKQVRRTLDQLLLLRSMLDDRDTADTEDHDRKADREESKHSAMLHKRFITKLKTKDTL